MNNLTEIIEGVEKFAYEILIWLLLIPKTLISIILNPTWVPEYVGQELNDKTDDRFDSYISPVILILVSTLLPAAYFASVPRPGAQISGPVEAHVHEPMRFVVDARFADMTQTYHYEWTADEQAKQIFNHQYLADYAVFTWDKPGKKQIHVEADNQQGEIYTNAFTVNILDENVPSTVSIDDGYAGTTRGSGQDFLSSLQEPSGLFITFIFLLMPMVFALAIDRLRGVAFSRRAFMHSFYIQCYYFSPVTLSFWSLLLGFAYFMNPQKEKSLVLLPALAVVLLLVWLFINETRLVMKEKNFNILLGIAFTGSCYILISLLLYVIIKLALNPEAFRKSLWFFYGTAVVGVIAFAVLRSVARLIRKLFK